MNRVPVIFCVALLASACVTEPEVEEVAQESAIHREHVVGDVWHHTIEVTVGSGPNAMLRLHRIVRENAPGVPKSTVSSVMLLHGDFSSFTTNFAPGPDSMAVYLAQHDIDVWGFDRRWASAPVDAEISDFGDMGLAQEVGDIGKAMAIARGIRILTGGSLDRMILAGFSRGGQLAYAYTSIEATKPAWQRHVKGLVPLDVYYDIAPEDEALRQTACANAAFERELLAAGVTDSENGFFIAMGELALAAPDEPSPLIDGFTNLGALLFAVGQTYVFFPATPLYHLNAPELDDNGVAIALRESPVGVVGTWFANASPHQSMREAAESDGLWCNEPPLAIDAPLSRIRVPLFYLGAAGGFGDHGLYSTTRVASTDVTSLVIRRFGPEQEAEDFGHADLLFATDAPSLVWAPLASWIQSH